MSREVTITVGPGQKCQFKVGDVIRFKGDSQEPVTVVAIKRLTKKEIAEQERRNEMTKREAERFDNHCPECGHEWDDE